MACTRLLRTTTTSSRFRFPNSSSSSITSSKIGDFGNFGDKNQKNVYKNQINVKEPVTSVKASVATSERVVVLDPKTDGGDLVSMVRRILNMALLWLKMVTKRRTLKFNAQTLIEKVIIDSRFFALFAVAGSLVGSVLCFLEGSFVVIESYFQYFHALSESSSDLSHVAELLIEAIDMYLIGTAMLIFGMGLHVMFVGAKHLESKGSQLPSSNFFGLFYLKEIPKWAAMGSISQAKSKMGHAVMMIMQVGLLEKFKGVPLVSGLDLACFAGAIFVSSVSIFLLSRLSIKGGLISTKFRL